jgi:hypothetical protein
MVAGRVLDGAEPLLVDMPTMVIFISKKHVQVGVWFQVLLEKEIG